MKKKAFRKLYGLAAIMLTGAFIFSSCKDDDKEEQKKPLITSVAPSEAYVGETVTITGENFMAEGKATKVNFGSTKVTPTENTVSFISVKVPELEPGSVNISVSCGEQVSATTTFKVLEKTVMPMEFSDFAPKKGKYQTEITINGKNFDDNVKVYINGKEQTEKTVNTEGTEIKVKLAKQTGSGKVVLKRDGESDVESAEALEYELTYTLEKFSDTYAYNMAIAKDGTIYLSDHNYFVKVNSNGVPLDTLMYYKYKYDGIFIADDGMVYIASNYEFVLSYNPETREIDTVANDINTEFPEDITGDNNGNLYISNEEKLVKIDIATKTTKVIASISGDDCGGLLLESDFLFVASSKGVFKINKDGGSPEYIVEGYKLNASGICSYSTGDIFVTGNQNNNLYRLDANNKFEEFVPASELKIIDSDFGQTLGLTKDNEGNLFVLSSGGIAKVMVK